jgi:hypothetical protein
MSTCIHSRAHSCWDCAGDRIAELEAEHTSFVTMVRESAQRELERERAAHERTKAELELVRRAYDGEQENMRKNVAATARAVAERDAARAEAAEMKRQRDAYCDGAFHNAAERDAVQARADKAEAAHERCAALVEWASLDWDNGDPRKVISAAIRAQAIAAVDARKAPTVEYCHCATPNVADSPFCINCKRPVDASKAVKP